MIFACSMRQTASIARCVSLLAHAPEKTTSCRTAQGRGPRRRGPPQSDRHDFLASFSVSARRRFSCSRSSGVTHVAEILRSRRAGGSRSRTRRHRVGAALDPFDRLVERAHLPDPVAGDQLLGLGERSVDDRRLVPENWTRAPLELGCRPSPASMMPAFTSSSLYFIIARQQLLAGHHAGFAVLGRLDDHHESHVAVSLVRIEPAFRGGSVDTSSDPRGNRQPGRKIFSGLESTGNCAP